MEKNHQREVNTRLIERIERLSRELGKKEGAQVAIFLVYNV